MRVERQRASADNAVPTPFCANVVRMTNGLPQPAGSPVSYPQLFIASTVYTLKFSLLAQFELDKHGIDLKQLMETLVPRLPDGKPDHNSPMKPGRVVAMMTLFAACTAHNFVERRQPIRTADEWAAIIPDDQWGECCKAVIEALRKVPQAATPSPTQPAETEAGAQPN